MFDMNHIEATQSIDVRIHSCVRETCIN